MKYPLSMPLEQQPTVLNQELQEKPLYILDQSFTRSLIPKIAILVLLGVIFYLGVLLNLSLLILEPDTELIIKITSVIILLVIVLLGIILASHHAKKPYFFYQNRIVFDRNEIYLTNILNILPKQNLLDKLFNTYHINLGGSFHLKHISQQVKLQEYLQQLMNYAKR